MYLFNVFLYDISLFSDDSFLLLFLTTISTNTKFKFDHTNEWYMHNPESVLEKETNKLLWDFELRINHLISARRPNLVIVNKKE